MRLELHLLQNFAPSNLNRDDTGSPKDCEFGGYRRARISSQCLKRAIRRSFKDDELLPAEHRAQRTKRLAQTLTDRLERQGVAPDSAAGIAKLALGGVGLPVGEDGKTQYLLFLGQQEIDSVVDICIAQRSALEPLLGGGAESKGKDAKKAAKEAFPADVAKRMATALDGGKAADLALFGRMLADLPERNIDAACQVAHAISTHKVSMEFDYYTAVDDLKPNDTAGADMIGTVEFNSACYYRYVHLDVDQLTHNLGGDRELVERAVRAFLLASVRAVPTGKQNSMAAQNPPSFVFAVVRDAGAWSLANAFLKPVRPERERDLVEGSIAAIDSYWKSLVTMYGEEGIRGAYVATLADAPLVNLAPNVVAGVGALADRIQDALFGRLAEAVR